MSDLTKPADLRAVAERVLVDAVDGDALSPFELALLDFGLASSVTKLDDVGIDRALAAAVAAGATAAQLQEVASLVSGLGVHTLMVTSAKIARATEVATRQLTPVEQDLWDRRVGGDPFWVQFEEELPGFLGAMLRLSTDQFEAFFDYCAVPWTSGTVRAQLKEIISMASDATLAHCFPPGFRLHLANAIKTGAGRAKILQALDRAAAN